MIHQFQNRSFIALACILAVCACTTAEVPRDQPPSPEQNQAPEQEQTPLKTQSPSQVYGEVFTTIAAAELFPTKDWVDAEPKASPDEIIAAWTTAQPETNDEIAGFAEKWFVLPEEKASVPHLSDNRAMRDHIEALWPELTRDAVRANPHSSLISLPEPYIIPGGRFREVYYWDAYFTMTGMGDDHAAIKRAMVDNFAALIGRYGFIPNANRTYYLSRSQPPFFFKMVGLLSPDDPAYEWAAYLPQLKAEHAFWMDGAEDLSPGSARARVVRLSDGTLLNRYWDNLSIPRDESYNDDVATARASSRPNPIDYRNLRAGAESGWDFSSRWFGGGDLSSIDTTLIIPPDLNSILYGLENAIAAGCARAGDRECEKEYRGMAETRAEAMRTHLWNDDLGIYDDYDFVHSTFKQNRTAAALYPLFFSIATPEQADRTAEMIENTLLAPGGLLTTPNETGQQWDAPNGWAPLHWIASKGLADYGHHQLAQEIAKRWLETASRTYCQTGKMVEKYDVTEAKPGGGGEYPTQDGFGWTNGVTLALMDEYPSLSGYGDIRQPPQDVNAITWCSAEVARIEGDR